MVFEPKSKWKIFNCFETIYSKAWCSGDDCDVAENRPQSSSENSLFAL